MEDPKDCEMAKGSGESCREAGRKWTWNRKRMNHEMIWYGKVGTEMGLKKVRGCDLWNGKETWDSVTGTENGESFEMQAFRFSLSLKAATLKDKTGA
jgi:hypothetical protein